VSWTEYRVRWGRVISAGLITSAFISVPVVALALLWSERGFLFTAVTIYAVFFASVALHEFGHAVAAKLLGYPVKVIFFKGGIAVVPLGVVTLRAYTLMSLFPLVFTFIAYLASLLVAPPAAPWVAWLYAGLSGGDALNVLIARLRGDEKYRYSFPHGKLLIEVSKA